MRLHTTAAALALLAVTGVTRAADHLDNTGLTPPGGDPAIDITDLYAFASPECDDCTVLVMGVNGLTPAGVDAAFQRRALYRLRIDTDGDAVQDRSFTINFGPVRGDGTQRYSVKMRTPGEGTRVIIRNRDGRTTPIGSDPDVANGELGIRAFAGMQDDPFFFDLPGFLALDFCSTDPAPDTFAGTNIGAIVLEVPNAVLALDGPAVGVWAETWRGGQRIDRKGRPAANTVFIPANPIEPDEESMKAAFNASPPAMDRARWRPEVLDTLEVFYGAGSPDAAGLADFLTPDLLTLDVGEPAGFPNGRRLADDVIDIELGLVTAGAIATDCVDGNDVALADEFPYLGPPHS